MAAATSLPHRQVIQARGLLRASEGVANDEIGRRCGMDSDTVRRWRVRFAQEGTAGVGKIAVGRGRKPSLPAGMVEEVLQIWADHQLQPWTWTNNVVAPAHVTVSGAPVSAAGTSKNPALSARSGLPSLRRKRQLYAPLP